MIEKSAGYADGEYAEPHAEWSAEGESWSLALTHDCVASGCNDGGLDNTIAYHPDSFEYMIAEQQISQFVVMIERQRKYGPKNITRTSNPIGAIAIRLGDKLSRLEELSQGRGDPDADDESLRDTLIDIANYATIAMCVQAGIWTKDGCPPLEDNQPDDD